MTDALAWIGAFLAFAALAMAGNAISQLAALKKEFQQLREEMRRGSTGS